MKIIFFSVCLLFCFHAKAEVIATVEYPNVLEGDVVELRLSSDTTKKGSPDLSVLDNDFYVVGTSNAASYQNINGQVNMSYDFILILVPRKNGILTIPEIEWEKEKSNSIKISVKPAASSYENKITISGFVVDDKVYENAALTYRVEVMSDVGFIDRNFIAPTMEDAEIIPVGEIQIGQKTENETVFRTLTQDYIIFPKKVGDKEKIIGAGFQGVFVKEKKSKASSFEPFIYGALTGQRKSVFLRADDSDVTVLARPDSWQNKWWLPAKDVKMAETYTPNKEKIKLGDSLTRTIEIEAFGVMGSQLPDVKILSTDDFKVYSEAPQKDTLYNPKQGIVGTLKQSFVFVPLRTEALVLPEVKLSWFDVKSGETKIAILPEKQINVEKNELIVPPAVVNKENETLPDEKIVIEDQQKSDKYASENSFLYFIAGLSIGLILFLIFMLVLYHPKKKKLPDLYPKK